MPVLGKAGKSRLVFVELQPENRRIRMRIGGHGIIVAVCDFPGIVQPFQRNLTIGKGGADGMGDNIEDPGAVNYQASLDSIHGSVLAKLKPVPGKRRCYVAVARIIF